MPMFEYHCKTCEARVDKLVRSETPEAEIICPSCGSSEIDRRLSLFGCIGGGKDSGVSEQPKKCSPKFG